MDDAITNGSSRLEGRIGLRIKGGVLLVLIVEGNTRYPFHCLVIQSCCLTGR